LTCIFDKKFLIFIIFFIKVWIRFISYWFNIILNDFLFNYRLLFLIFYRFKSFDCFKLKKRWISILSINDCLITYAIIRLITIFIYLYLCIGNLLLFNIIKCIDIFILISFSWALLTIKTFLFLVTFFWEYLTMFIIILNSFRKFSRLFIFSCIFLKIFVMN
jgi:hypothetical protein